MHLYLPGIWYKKNNKGEIIGMMVVYVDDILICSFGIDVNVLLDIISEDLPLSEREPLHRNVGVLYEIQQTAVYSVLNGITLRPWTSALVLLLTLRSL